MLPAPDICHRARLARDPRFDGRFYLGVVTTGVFCRPICPARAPDEDNVRYFASAAAAVDAGFRPCLRCRPECARSVPEWTLASDTVIRGLRHINDGFLGRASVAALAVKLSISARQLNRLFRAELGATPTSLARMQRAQLAKRLLSDTALKMTDVALAAGYGSVRRFNDEMVRVFGRAPRQLRRARRPEPNGGSACEETPLSLALPVRRPYNADWVFGFLGRRALAGLEEVAGHCYRRRMADGSSVAARLEGDNIIVDIPPRHARDLASVLGRIRRILDLDADPIAIDERLAADPLLGRWVAEAPGLRVPGVWNDFEYAVRAILGQQVSVARATQLAERLLEEFGGSPGDLADADVASLGIPGRRGAAVRLLARAVLDRGDEFLRDPDAVREVLLAIPGIGRWTAEYIAMRVTRDPDAFVDSDWVVAKVLEVSPARARKLAEAWRPWRAYAVMYLWYGAARRSNSSSS